MGPLFRQAYTVGVTDVRKAREDFLRRFSLPILVLVSVIVIGTLGYYLLWRSYSATWLDAVYMTFITITTVGYNEIHPLDSLGRLFTIAISITGIASLFYLFTVVMDQLVSFRLNSAREKRKMQEAIAALKHHIILAGLGRMGRRAALELADESKAFVVIDEDETALQFAEEQGYLYVSGEASEDEVLEQAGVKEAHGLIATTSSDASNAFIVMSAKALNPELLIIARAESETSTQKLLKAGADRVLDPYTIGGRRLANLFLHPAAVDFLETTIRRGKVQLDVADFEVLDGSEFVGKSLLELDVRRRYGVNILAVLRSGEPIINPGGDFTLEAGDQLIALGTQDQLGELGDYASANQ